MNYPRLLLISMSVLLSVAQVHAQFFRPRIYSNEFLNIGSGARALGMGSTSVASASNATSGYWNPAGLSYNKDYPSITAMHAEYFSGIGKYDYAAAVFPLNSEKPSSFGISAIRFGVDDIANTLDLVQPDGSINYDNITTFSSADYALLLSYSRMLIDEADRSLSIGGNAKIIYRKVGSFANAIGFGLDGGVMYRTGNLQLGAVVRDITTTFNAWRFSFTEREKEVLYLTNNDIPVKSTEMTAPRLIAGGAYTFKLSKKVNLMAEADIDLTFDGKRNTVVSSDFVSVDPHIGVEASFGSSFFLRAGVSNFQKALSDGDTLNQKKVWIYQPSLGAGFKVGNVAIDYAFTNLANQSNPLYTHVFSLRLDIMPKSATAEKNKGTGVPELPRAEKPKKDKGYYPTP